MQGHARDLKDVFSAQGFAPPFRLLLGAGIDGRDKGIDGLPAFVQRYNRFTVGGNTQGLNRIIRNRRGHSADHISHCLPDFARVQFHPAGLWLIKGIFAVSPGQRLPRCAERDGFATGDADISVPVNSCWPHNAMGYQLEYNRP